jgi:hypothetical protein
MMDSSKSSVLVNLTRKKTFKNDIASLDVAGIILDIILIIT